MSKQIDLDTTKFQAALARFRTISKRSAEIVLREQARGTLRKIIDSTPPGGRNAQGQAAKKRGEAKVEGDIRKLMEGVAAKQASGESPAEVLRNNRSKDGKGAVVGNVVQKIKVRKSDLAKLIRDKKRMVGFLASGWKSAATKLGINIPAWISRHSAPGSGRIRSTATSIEVSATNQVEGAPALEMERRVQTALDLQAAAMVRRVEHFAAREAAKKAGFKA